MALPPRYRLIDLFAGCGGMTRGFVDTDRFDPVFAVEADRNAAATYRENFAGTEVAEERIEQVERFPHADVVIGGPPCQGFSMLNRGRETTESRRLWREYLRALDAVAPSVFVMENVPQMLDSSEYKQFEAAVRGHGYDIEAKVVNMADYGVPQRRHRAIVVGSKIGPIAWPRRTHGEEAGFDTEKWRSFRSAVAELPLRPDGRNWHRDRNPWADTIRRYKAVPPDGGSRFEMQRTLEAEGLGHLIPPCWRRHRSGSHDVFGRLWWERPATTIRTEFFKPEKGRYLHPSEHRAITVREAARLMSMEDDFVFPATQSMTVVGRQIGNAVPPLLARHFAEPIAEALDALEADRSEPMAA